MTFVTDQGIDLQLLGSAADEARQVSTLTAPHHNTPSASHRHTTHSMQTHVVPRGTIWQARRSRTCMRTPTHAPHSRARTQRGVALNPDASRHDAMQTQSWSPMPEEHVLDALHQILDVTLSPPPCPALPPSCRPPLDETLWRPPLDKDTCPSTAPLVPANLCVPLCHPLCRCRCIMASPS